MSNATDVSTFVEREQEEETYYKDNSYEIPPQQEAIKEEEIEEKDEDLVKLYKKIASITHPDVIPSGEKQELKEKRERRNK